MGADNKFNKGSRRRGNRGGKKFYQSQPRVRIDHKLNMDCNICEKSIRELVTAIAYGPEGEPAHFDCVIKKIREENQLSATEKVQYLGNGTFGIVETKKPTPTNPLAFEIKRKIVLENKDLNPEWRQVIKESAIRIER